MTCAQLGGDQADDIGAAVKLALPFGYDEINLNCGCPSVETGGGRYGASLMRSPHKTAEIVSEMCRASAGNTPISVKCRIGVAETVQDALSATASAAEVEAMYNRLAEFANACRDAGAAHIVVHCREAVMAGLSPLDNRAIPPLWPRLVHRLASDQQSLACSPMPITINGGICSVEAANAELAKCSALAGVQAGRWPLCRPLDILLIDSHFATGEPRSGQMDATEASAVSDVSSLQSSAEMERKPVMECAPTLQLEDTIVQSAVVTAIMRYARYASKEKLQGNATAAELVRPLALVVSEIEERQDEAGAQGMAREAGAAELVMEALADSCSVLLGTDLSGNSRGELRKALQKVCGKKILQKQKRNRQEGLRSHVALQS